MNSLFCGVARWGCRVEVRVVQVLNSGQKEG